MDYEQTWKEDCDFFGVLSLLQRVNAIYDRTSSSFVVLAQSDRNAIAFVELLQTSCAAEGSPVGERKVCYKLAKEAQEETMNRRRRKKVTIFYEMNGRGKIAVEMNMGRTEPAVRSRSSIEFVSTIRTLDIRVPVMLLCI